MKTGTLTKFIFSQVKTDTTVLLFPDTDITNLGGMFADVLYISAAFIFHFPTVTCKNYKLQVTVITGTWKNLNC